MDDKNLNRTDKENFSDIASMFQIREELDRINSQLKDARNQEVRYMREYYKSGETERDKEIWDYMIKRVRELENKKYKLSEELKNLQKRVLPLDPGNWIRDPGETKAIGGSYIIYRNPSHPEYGELKVYKFGGWSMQRVAANACVEFADGKFEWTGDSASVRADNFLEKYFGIK